MTGLKEAGYWETLWDGRSDKGYAVSAGVYFYHLETPSFKQTKKMILL